MKVYKPLCLLCLLLSLFSCEKQKFEFKSNIQVRTNISITEERIAAADRITLQDILSELDLDPTDKIKSIRVESVQVNWTVDDDNEADELQLTGRVKDLTNNDFIAFFGCFSCLESETVSLTGNEGIHRVETLLQDGIDRLNVNLASITDFCNSSTQEFGVAFFSTSKEPPSVGLVVILNVGVVFERCMETVFLTGGEECTDGPCDQ